MAKSKFITRKEFQNFKSWIKTEVRMGYFFSLLLVFLIMFIVIAIKFRLNQFLFI